MDLDSRHIGSDTATLSATDGCVGSNSQLLQGVLRVGREWLDRISIHDPAFKSAAQMVEVTENLINDADYSVNGMTTARALLCCNCRRLDAVKERCAGTSLDRCELISTSSSSSVQPNQRSIRR